MTEREKPGVIILAGGRSERMKYPKPWLSFHNGTSFLEKIVKEYYEFGSRHLVVVINEKFCESPWEKKISKLKSFATIVENNEVEKGKSHSILMGLNHVQSDDFVFIQNIDNPFIDRALLTVLDEKKIKKGYVVPVYKGKSGHPVLICKIIMDELKSSPPDSLHFREILRKYDRSEVEYADKGILANINLPEDYRIAFNKEISLSRV